MCLGFQHSLIHMLEKWEKKALDKEGNMSAVFMVLSKPFNTINHDLLHTFFIKKTIFCPSLDFLNVMLEITLKFS